MRPAKRLALNPTNLAQNTKNYVLVGEDGGLSLTFSGLTQPRNLEAKFFLVWLINTLGEERELLNASWLTVTANGDSTLAIYRNPLRRFNQILVTAESDNRVARPNEQRALFFLQSPTPLWERLL